MGPWLFFLCWAKFATLDNAVHLRSWVGASEGLECLAGRYRKYIMGEHMGAGRGFALYGTSLSARPARSSRGFSIFWRNRSFCAASAQQGNCAVATATVKNARYLCIDKLGCTLPKWDPQDIYLCMHAKIKWGCHFPFQEDVPY